MRQRGVFADHLYQVLTLNGAHFEP